MSQIENIILIEPAADPVIGWNPLDADGQSPFGVVQELIAIFHHCFWSQSWGPRLEELLFMTLLALAVAKLTLPEACLFLTRPELRNSVLRLVNIPEVREFWTSRFERLSPSQRLLVVEPALNKLSIFTRPPLRYLFGQQKGALDLDRALAEGRTILAKFPSGELYGNHYVIAALLIAKLKAAVYRRPSHAKPYVVLLDEFQEIVGW
jgi:hypothetical protein